MGRDLKRIGVKLRFKLEQSEKNLRYENYNGNGSEIGYTSAKDLGWV